MWRRTPTGVELDVRVIPRSRKTEIDGVREDALLVRVAAAPVGGAANDELVELLAEQFAVPRRAVRIVAGGRTRQKRVVVDGVSEEAVRTLFGS
jgi:uncharacterized protein (TIGR00251 family)